MPTEIQVSGLKPSRDFIILGLLITARIFWFPIPEGSLKEKLFLPCTVSTKSAIEVLLDRIPVHFIFFNSGMKFDSSASMEWSPTEVIDFKVGAVYQNQKGTSLKVTSQFLTPFAGWKRTSFNAG